MLFSRSKLWKPSLAFLIIFVFFAQSAQAKSLPPHVDVTAVLRIATLADAHYGWTDVSHFYASDIVQAWMEDDGYPTVDLALNLGDFISGDHYDSEEELEGLWREAMMDSFSQLVLPWMFVAGNHDVEEDMPNVPAELRAAMAQRETGVMQQNYAFMWNNILFLLFGWSDDRFGGTSADTREWLEFMTSQYPTTTTVIVSHAGPHGEWWEEFLSANPQVALYIHGHDHQFKHTVLAETDVVGYGHTNDSVSWVGQPWTGCIEITEFGISGRLYDVLQQDWVTGRNDFTAVFSTGIAPTWLEWFAVASHVQDGETVVFPNKILAEGHRLQLVGAQVSSGDGATTDFAVSFNGQEFSHAGALAPQAVVEFAVDPALMTHMLRLDSKIGGSGHGFVQVVYDKPLLWSAQVSFGVGEQSSDYMEFEVDKVAQYTHGGLVTLSPLRPGVTVESARPRAIRGGEYTAYQVHEAELPGVLRARTAEPVPPKLIFGDLEMPSQVEQFEDFQVKTTVTNAGGPVTIKVGLHVNSQEKDVKVLHLAEGETADVVFNLRFSAAGKYQIEAAGTANTLTVKPALPF